MGMEFVDPVKESSFTKLPADGSRYFRKEVLGVVVSMDFVEGITIPPHHRWFTVDELRAAFVLGLCNPHLRDLLVLAAFSDVRF